MKIAVFVKQCGLSVQDYIRTVCIVFETSVEQMSVRDDVQFVDPAVDNSFTHAIFMNMEIPPVDVIGRITRSNIIGFSLEPKVFFNPNALQAQQINQCAKKYISGQRLRIRNSMSGFGFVCVPWQLAIPKTIQERIKPTGMLSLPLSHKKETPLHRYRHELALALLRDPRNINVHIWGNGCASVQQALGHCDDRIKTKFHDVEPYINYQATIAIENSVERFYLTEKIINPICCGCVPLYLGCSEIDQFFPNGYIKLTGNLLQDVEIIANLSEPDITAVDLAKAKQHFVKKWSWPAYVKSLFET